MGDLPVSQSMELDQRRWNSRLASLPYHHILQSWEWGEFKQRYGWRAERLAFQRGNEVVAMAQVLVRRARPLPFSIMYVPKGPMLDYQDESLRQVVLQALTAHGRKHHAIFVKIDPDVVLARGEPGSDEDRSDVLGLALQDDLHALGWRFSVNQIQFRNTVQLDLTQAEESMLKAMKPKTRYNLRLSQRKGVKVRVGNRGDLALLFDMYAETAERNEFIIRPLEYYYDAWGGFMDAGLSCPLIAEYEGDPIAAVILFCFGQKVWYMYGASRELHRETMPNHLLQWEAIRWAKAQGYHVYDMWGAPDEFAESDPMWGVWRFKAGFGGLVVRHIGAWDVILSPFWYWIYRLVIPGYLASGRLLRGILRLARTSH